VDAETYNNNQDVVNNIKKLLDKIKNIHVKTSPERAKKARGKYY
jgi:hypothetical protein